MRYFCLSLAFMAAACGPSPELLEQIIPESWTLLAVGDLMPGRRVEPLLREEGYAEVFGDVLPLIHQADLSLANLESAVTTHRVRWPKTYTFRVDPFVAEELKLAGWDVLTIANNHSWDYGEEGFLDTLQALESAGIPAPGAGKNKEEAGCPFQVTIGGQLVRILSLGGFPVERSGFNGQKIMKAGESRPGTLWADEDGLDAVRSAMGDTLGLDIVMLHAGLENSPGPTEAIKKLFRSLADAGADVVIGHHPHVIHTYEHYNGSLLVYSLGDFVFDGMWDNPAALDGLVMLATFEGRRLVGLEWIPTIIEGPRIRLRKRSDGDLHYPAVFRPMLRYPENLFNVPNFPVHP